MLLRILRIVLGAILVFSAFVKLNDPLGFAYKLEEYFAEDVLNLTFFLPYTLAIAIFVSLVEMLIAIALITKYRLKFSLKLAVLMFVFFGFLTFYSAYFQKVSDCGCFGDAIKFKPWESFAKDIVLLLVTLLLLAKIKVEKASKFSVFYFYIFAIISVVLPYYTLNNLPIVDFRPFKIGVDINKAMEIPEDAPIDKYEDIWIYNVNGEDKSFSTEERPWDIQGAKFVDRKSILVEEGFKPSIESFNIYDGNDDVSSRILKENDVLLVFSVDLSKLSDSKIEKIQNLLAKHHGYIVTGGSDKSISDFSKKLKKTAKIYQMDNTLCKTIIRSNPGVLRLQKGRIVKKYDL